MILSVVELRTFITTTLTDQVLEARLSALEAAIRKYTNNNFQNQKIRFNCDAASGKLQLSTIYLKVGDTVQINGSKYNDGVYNITAKTSEITLDKALYDEEGLMITKVEYPLDIQLGAVELIRWDINNQDKVGIASETISRHTVAYQQLDGSNTVSGYPAALFGFCKPYCRWRT